MNPGFAAERLLKQPELPNPAKPAAFAMTRSRTAERCGDGGSFPGSSNGTSGALPMRGGVTFIKKPCARDKSP